MCCEMLANPRGGGGGGGGNFLDKNLKKNKT